MLTESEKQDYQELLSYLQDPTPDLEDRLFLDDDDDEDEEDEEYNKALKEALGDAYDEENKADRLFDILADDLLLQLDWKEEVTELVSGLEIMLKDNFDISISLAGIEDRYDNLSQNQIFSDINRVLAQHGFTVANIESGWDQFWIIVFPSQHQTRVQELVEKLGCTLLID